MRALVDKVADKDQNIFVLLIFDLQQQLPELRQAAMHIAYGNETIRAVLW